MPSEWDYPTLIEIAKSSDTSEVQRLLIDIVVGRRAGTFFGAIPMKRINGLSEQVTQITSYPGVTWRSLGEGLEETKGGERDILFNVALVSSLSGAEANKAEKHDGGIIAYRAKEDQKHLRALGKEADEGMFYNQAANKSIEGIMRMLPSTASTYVSCGASNETFSIYAFIFGDEGFYGFYSPFADGQIFSVRDYGLQMDTVLQGGVSKKIGKYYTEFNACFGYAIANPKAIGRITKFDLSNRLTVDKFTELYDAMDGKPDMFVCNFKGGGEFNVLKDYIVKMTPEETGLSYTVLSYDGVPILVDTNLSSVENTL